MRQVFRPSLGAVLAGVLLLAVLLTAALIHLPWSWTARRNVSDVAERLNAEVTASVSRELASLLGSSAALAEALRSILAQGTIAPEEEAKREFLFLALLRSQPAMSRLSFGWPDGRFFGAEKVGAQHIRMVEVRDGQLRIDQYEILPDDVMFLDRSFSASSYLATEQAWFTTATGREGTVWQQAQRFPDGEVASITLSQPLVQYGRELGVVAATIDLTRISEFLGSLQIGGSGTVAVLDPLGRIVASGDPADLAAAEAASLRQLAAVDATQNQLLAQIARTIVTQGIDLARVALTRLYRLDGPDGSFLVNLARLGFQGWVVATVIPERDFLAEIDRNTHVLLWLLLAFTAAVAVLALVVSSRLIVRPLRTIEGQLRHIEDFKPEHVRLVPSSLRELDSLSRTLLRMGSGLHSFRKYLPAELVRTLVAQGVAARPDLHARELTVLFTDLAGFTRISERLGEEVVPLLTSYLTRSTRAVLAEGGTVDKFIGDAVMAFWGAPLADEEHALHACRSALRIRSALGEVSQGVAGGEGLRIRIGINTGRMLVGNVGSDDRLSYTVIGDPVNVASRLEALNKRYRTDIIIGEATRNAAAASIVTRELDLVAVYGRQGASRIFELVGLASDPESARAEAWVAPFEAGLKAYRRRAWDEAVALFEKVAVVRGIDDPPARQMIERCRQHTAEPPPPDWQSALMLDEK